MIEKIIDLDKDLFKYLNNKESVTDFFWIFITNDIVIFLMLISIISFILYKYDYKNFKGTLLLIILTFAATDLIHNHCFKELFQRLRPCWDPDISETCRILVDKGGEYGFVSGHATNFFGIISMVFLRITHLKSWIKYSLVICGFLICYSRIHVGKHYPLDVLFGALLGVMLALFIYKLSKSLFSSQKVYKNRN